MTELVDCPIGLQRDQFSQLRIALRRVRRADLVEHHRVPDDAATNGVSKPLQPQTVRQAPDTNPRHRGMPSQAAAANPSTKPCRFQITSSRSLQRRLGVGQLGSMPVRDTSIRIAEEVAQLVANNNDISDHVMNLVGLDQIYEVPIAKQSNFH